MVFFPLICLIFKRQGAFGALYVELRSRRNSAR